MSQDFATLDDCLLEIVCLIQWIEGKVIFIDVCATIFCIYVWGKYLPNIAHQEMPCTSHCVTSVEAINLVRLDSLKTSHQHVLSGLALTAGKISDLANEGDVDLK